MLNLFQRINSKAKRAIVANRTRARSRKIKSVCNCTGSVFVNGNGKISVPEKLTIENNVHLGGNYHINAHGKVFIGENTHISRNFVCYSCNHQYEGKLLPYDDTYLEKEVVIGRNVWIGMNVCIAPGVNIGEGSIIGIGSVVVKDVPMLAIVGGNPARVLKFRDELHYRRLEDAKAYGGPNGSPI